MKRSYLTPLLLGLVIIVSLGVAQSMGQPDPGATPTGGQAVVVMDFVKIFNDCAQIKDLNSMIKQRTEEIGKEAEQRREVIEAKQMELGAFQPGTTDYEARRKDLVRLNIDANVWLKIQEDEMDRSKFEWTRVVYEKAATAAESIAKERGATAVLQKTEFKPYEIEPTVQSLRRFIKERTVIYNAAEIEITDEVIRRMDASYKATGGKKQLDVTPPPVQ